MSERISTTFGSLGELFDGPHATPTRTSEGPLFLNISSLKSGRLDLSESDHVSSEDFVKWTRRVTPQADDLLFSYETRLGEAALMPAGVDACLGRRMALLRPDRTLVDPKFLLYFYLSPGFQQTIQKHTIHGATVTRIGLVSMPSWEVEIPPLNEQRAIAGVLGALDDKIAANDRTRLLLRELAKGLFDRALQAGTRDVEVSEIAEFHNRRRVPLSSRERDGRRGTVPYYGAAGRLGFIDEAIFDEQLVLVGEDGSVISDRGTPVVQYIWGPAWVNNHAHVLTGQGISTEALRIALERTNVMHLVTGAVQPKISMGNLKRLEITIPDDFAGVDARIQELTATERALSDEAKCLAASRDELLPLLMSGRLRVGEAEEAVEEVA